MTIGTDFSLFLQSKLASSFYNIDSNRVRHAALHERKEGWTEIWGNLEDEKEGGEKKMREDKKEDCWAMEDVAVQRMKEAHTPLPSVPLTLTQYRIAWYEQLVLRICNIPHVVLNSSYLSMESTGPLPYLMDLPTDEKKTNPPVLVGRQHPGAENKVIHEIEGENNGTSYFSTNSHIIDYLYKSSSYSHLLSKHLCLTMGSNNKEKGDELAYTSLIQHTLQPILYSLRYGDLDTWEQVYRNQCINAALDPNGLLEEDRGGGDTKRRFFNVFSWYQAWSERIVHTSHLVSSFNPMIQKDILSPSLSDSSSSTSESSKDINISKAMQQARETYQSFETKLSQGNGKHLCNTTKPTLVDVYFFSHLCEALCDVHLVLVLSEFPCIVLFFQQFYEEYFGGKGGEKKDGEKKKEEEEWITWNDKMNSVNQFNRIPMGGTVVGGSTTSSSSWQSNRSNRGITKKYQDALQMMQSLALHCHDLREALADVALQRREQQEEAEALSVAATTTAVTDAGKEEGVVFTKRAAGWMFHRMRMEGNLYSESKNKSASSQKQKQQQYKKKPSAYNDEEDPKQEEEDEITKKNRAHMEKMRRDNKKNDELWMSSVLIGSVMAFVFAAAKSSAAAASKK